MKHLALIIGILAALTGAVAAFEIARAGEVHLTGRWYWYIALRGPAAYSLAAGALFAGTVPLFASCILWKPSARRQLQIARNASFAAAVGLFAISFFGAAMARGGVSAL